MFTFKNRMCGFWVRFDIIRRMKTDWRRWWVINCLYHISERKNELQRWVPEGELYLWMCGLDGTQPLDDLLRSKISIFRTPIKKLRYIITEFLFGKKDFLSIARIIDHCAGTEIGWIEKGVNPGGYGNEERIRLTDRGESAYALSSFLVYLLKTYWQLATLSYTIAITVTIFLFKIITSQ